MRSARGFSARPSSQPCAERAAHLSQLATRARPGLLILYHQSYQFTESTEDDLMREMRAVYRGRFVSGHDLDVF